MCWHFSNIIAVRCLFKMSQIRHINFTRTSRKIGNDKPLFYFLLSLHVCDGQKKRVTTKINFTYYLLFLELTLYLCTVQLNTATKTEDVNRTSFSKFSHFCIFIVREISIREILCFAKENILISK